MSVNNNQPVNMPPVNFFMAGAEYITDKLNFEFIDTDNLSAFDNVNLATSRPEDLTSRFLNNEAPPPPEPPPEDNNGTGFFDKIKNIFNSQNKEDD